MNRISIRDGVLFSTLAAVAMTLYDYYFMGHMQHEMLPVIYRIMDPEYLNNDLFTNGSELFNEDYWFSKFIIALSNLASLPVVFFALNIVANIASALAAFFTARYLFKDNNVAGILAVVLVLCVMTMRLGYGSPPIRANFIASHMVRPLLYFAIYMAFKQKPIAVAILAGLAALVHPLEGPGTGGILLAAMAATLVWNGEKSLGKYLQIGLSFVMVLAAALVYVIPYFEQSSQGIPDDIFIEINLFRFPHHYLPSVFLTPTELLVGAGFIGAVVLATGAWMRSFTEERTWKRTFLSTCVILVLLCFLGYLFVEIWPSRIWLIAQTWRFLYIFKWIGQLMLAGITAQYIYQKGLLKSVPIWLSMVQPLATTATILSTRTNLKTSPKLLWGIQFVVLVVVVYLSRNLLKTQLPLFALLSAIALVLFSVSRKAHVLSWIGLAIFIAGLNFLNPVSDAVNGKGLHFKGYFRPIIYAKQHSYKTREISEFIKANTPENSVIMLPAPLSVVRILSERALFVDLSIPMEDHAMQEWFERMKLQYKIPSSNIGTLRDYDVMRIDLTDQELLNIKKKYTLDYVITKAEHSTQFPVLFESSGFKLLQLPTK